MTAILLASISSADNHPEYYTHYNQDFKEGSNLTIELGILDKVIFTHYGENYTFGVMGIGIETSTVRVEKRAFELAYNNPVYLDFDNDINDDLGIKLISIDEDSATYFLSLYKKPGDKEEEIINATNTTIDDEDTNLSSDNYTFINAVTANQDNNSPDDNLSSSYNISSDSSGLTNSSSYDYGSDESEKNAKDNKNKDSPTGGTTVNITLNFTIPEGSFIGLFLVLTIVSAGLIVYRRVRKRRLKEEISVSSNKKKRKTMKK